MAMTASEVRPPTMISISRPSPHPIYPPLAATSFPANQSLASDSSYSNTSRLIADGLEAPTTALTTEILQSSSADRMVSNGDSQIVPGIEEVDPLAKSEMGIITEQGYDLTTHQDDTPDILFRTTLQNTEDISGVGDCSFVEHSWPYKDLLACNGDFTLPLGYADIPHDVDSWSTTATICDEDHADLLEALRRDSWT
ncbi:hypothetical protein VTL71DRAFT_11019 [Oculimacula yallundae]|uniref:Uncharacterized protein n=1 Tax=Oculimacula yallundae TaxID=86028 RepID=A0ABR4CVA7_9HELO